jgi:dTDP-4-dehydrorhamnose reductase
VKVLITGADGQLGLAFQEELKLRNLDFFPTDINSCDITKKEQVNGLISKQRPTVLINCAAYNLVDDAEDNPEPAYSLNAKAVEILAKVCKDNNIFYVHFSTDYVFDGTKNTPYTEEDTPNPLNVYGKSKYKGEIAVCNTTENRLVFRTSWMYGKGKQNFFYKLKGWARQDKVLRISSDEISVPTYTHDIVTATLAGLEQEKRGLYHLTSSGYCSRYELAKYFLKKRGIDKEIVPVPSASFKQKAMRPLFSAMSNARLCHELNISIPPWQDGIDRYCNLCNF